MARSPEISNRQSCQPSFVKISEEPMEMWSGFWKLEVDGFLIGCGEDLDRLTKKEHQILAARAKAEVREFGIGIEHQNKEQRTRFARDLNRLLGHKVITDALLILRSAIEHEPS